MQEQSPIAGLPGPQTLSLYIPEQLLGLCRLLELDPEEVIQGFIYDLSQDPRNSRGKPVKRTMARQYFLAAGYGKESYSPTQIEKMLFALNRLRSKWRGDTPGFNRRFLIYVREYMEYWSKLWKYSKAGKARSGKLVKGRFPTHHSWILRLG